MKKLNDRGVALILVLSAILVLTVAAVDFAFNAHVAYSMASNDRYRLQAYYMARSAFALSRLQIELEKKLSQQIAQYASQLTGAISSQPLCQQLPFSTALLRGLLEGEGLPGLDQGEAEKEEGTGEEEEPKEEALSEEATGEETHDLGIQEEGRVKEFLDFEGDFGIECEDLQGKINLNYFRDVSPSPLSSDDNPKDMEAYERHKSVLISLFLTPNFKKFFEEGGRDEARKIATNIGDWVDKNDRINEALGIERGYEDSLYVDSETPYRVKNGKFTSLEELLLVAGIGDDLFGAMKNFVTVYGDDKINPCLAGSDVVRALVIHYSENTEGLVPVSSDNEELMQQVDTALSEVCLNPKPDVGDLASTLITIIGGENAKAKGLQDMMTTERRFYSVRAYGMVGDVTASIDFVLDTKGDSKEWKVLYFRLK